MTAGTLGAFGGITTTAPVLGAAEVAKIGRTTGITRGRVTAIELDDVIVGYGEELGELSFDDQIEVEGLGTAAFSRGGQCRAGGRSQGTAVDVRARVTGPIRARLRARA